MSDIRDLGDGCTIPKFGAYLYEHEIGKKRKETNCWISSLLNNR